MVLFRAQFVNLIISFSSAPRINFQIRICHRYLTIDHIDYVAYIIYDLINAFQ